jgi:hypothetical protein
MRSTEKQSAASEKVGLRSDEEPYHCNALNCPGIGPEVVRNLNHALSSGQAARHDPERIHRAQRAGRIALELRNKGYVGLNEADQVFIINVLNMVRDGKTS